MLVFVVLFIWVKGGRSDHEDYQKTDGGALPTPDVVVARANVRPQGMVLVCFVFFLLYSLCLFT
jgi:hypothetical protein